MTCSVHRRLLVQTLATPTTESRVMCPVGISELSSSDFLWFILGCRLRTECFLHLHSQDSIEQSQNDLDDHHLRKCQYHMAASKPCRTLHTSFNRVTQNYLHLQQSTLWGHPILARNVLHCLLQVILAFALGQRYASSKFPHSDEYEQPSKEKTASKESK